MPDGEKGWDPDYFSKQAGINPKVDIGAVTHVDVTGGPLSDEQVSAANKAAEAMDSGNDSGSDASKQ